ncbi:MAG: Type 1 glutamine amidotransferase-like domain-containing protein [Acidimicrobiales bacterium]
MTTRRILATSGGFVAGTVQFTYRLGDMLLDALTQTGQTRPRVCLVYTATGDATDYYAHSYEAFNAAGCDVTELRLFTQPSADPEERLTSSDLVWVGGGSVANLLALWRLHGVDAAMATAWERGVILSGVSAGSLCWHVGGTTDSFGPTLKPVTNALGLLPYANGVHYDSEAQRRPLLHELIANHTLPALAFATDDHTGLWYDGVEPTRVVADAPVDPATGPAAYRVELVGSDVVETRVGVGGRF